MYRDTLVHTARHLARPAQVVQEGLSRGFRLTYRNVRLQLGDDGYELDAHLARTRGLGSRHGEWHPELGSGIGKSKVRGHDPDDGIAEPIELDRPTHEARLSAERPLPQAVTQDDDTVLAWCLLFLTEVTAEEGLDAEHGEERGRGVLTLDAAGLRSSCQVEADVSVHGHGFENVIAVAPGSKVLQRKSSHLLRIWAHARAGLPNPNERLRFFIGERAQKHRIHGAEDRRVQPDSESEGYEARLIMRVLLESILYGLAGGAVGILVAYWGVRMLRLLRPSDLPLLENIGISGAVLGFNFGVAVITAILVGLVPAFRASRIDLVNGLKGLGTGLVQSTPKRMRNALAVTEVALALLLFIAAGLMFRSFSTLTNVDPGYEPKNVLTFRLNLPSTKYESGTAQKSFYDRLRETLDAVPGVHANGIVNMLPLDQGRFITSLAIEGRPPVEDLMNVPRASMRVTSPGFFQSMGIRLVKGRGLEERDRDGAPRVAVINESLAARYFENEEPLGQRIQRLGEIVGVVADVRQEGLDAAPEPEVYLDYRQVRDPMAGRMLATMSVAARIDPRQAGLVGEVRRRVGEIDAELPLADLRPMSERLRDSVARPRLYAVLLILFAGLALILAVSGVYSVISYSVSQRTRETGVRMAFGATSSDIVRLVSRDGLRILLWGLALGLLASFGLSRYLRSVLFEIEPFDPLTFLIVAMVLGGAVLAASHIPARQASRTDAMKALHYDG